MTKIQLRHDTSTKWQTANPILASGEVGVETDTQKIKVGNGSAAYNSLQYIGTTRTTNETNLNNIIEPNTYYFPGARWSNLTNKPFNDSSHTVAWMIVISYNSGNTAQIVFSGRGDYSDCDFAIRYRINSKWNSWCYVRPTNVLSYNIPGGLVVLDNSGKLPAVDGSQLKNLPATTPSNMVTTNTNQTISGNKTFTGNIFSIQPGGYQTFQTTTSNVYIGTSNSGVSTYAQVNLITSESGNIRVLRGGASGTPSTVLDTGNFSTSSPTGNLKYWTGIETDYTAISTKDPDTLYRTTDTNKVFLGTIQLGG